MFERLHHHSKIQSTPECAILKSKNSKNFSLERPSKNVSLGPAVALGVHGCSKTFGRMYGSDKFQAHVW